MQSTSHEMPGWMKHKLESRLLAEIPITSDMPDDTTLMTESEEELESLDGIERGERKTWLKTQHSKNKDHVILFHHFMTNRRGGLETRRDFLSRSNS